MLIRCIRCQTQFEQKTNERTCGCKRTKKYASSKIASKRWQVNHTERIYFVRLGKYFQNPIYQWIREFVTTEKFTHYESFKKQAKKY